MAVIRQVLTLESVPGSSTFLKQSHYARASDLSILGVRVDIDGVLGPGGTCTLKID